MTFTLILTNILKDYAGGRDRLELIPGLTISEVLEATGIPSALVAAVFRGDDLVPKDYQPHDGEMIRLVTIMWGG